MLTDHEKALKNLIGYPSRLNKLWIKQPYHYTVLPFKL